MKKLRELWKAWRHGDEIVAELNIPISVVILGVVTLLFLLNLMLR